MHQGLEEKREGEAEGVRQRAGQDHRLPGTRERPLGVPELEGRFHEAMAIAATPGSVEVRRASPPCRAGSYSAITRSQPESEAANRP